MLNNRMGIYQKMYKPTKVKKPRDPSLPPPENLFSQGKKIRDTQAIIEDMQILIANQHNAIESLRAQLRRSEYRIDLLTNIVKRIETPKRGK